MKIMSMGILLMLLTIIANAGPGEMHYIKPLQANVYESSSAASKVKFIVAIGRKLVEFDRKNGFVYVGVDKSGGKDGWIKASDLSPTDPDGLKY